MCTLVQDGVSGGQFSMYGPRMMHVVSCGYVSRWKWTFNMLFILKTADYPLPNVRFISREFSRAARTGCSGRQTGF
jgi:hypothetical protein